MFKILELPFADKGYFINLARSTDRLDRVNMLIEEFKIEGLERFEALTDEFTQFACTKSHLAVFKQSLEEDLDIIFVAEDDFDIRETLYNGYEISKLFSEVIKQVYEDLKTVEWDVLQFGCNPKAEFIPLTPTLALNSKSTGAWAYLIKKNAYKYLLENLNYHRDLTAIDDYLPLLNDKGFTTLTTLPLTVGHAVGFESTLQPRGPVNYDSWIIGNYHKFFFDPYRGIDLSQGLFQKEVTVVVAGHLFDNHLYYLNYLLHSLPEVLLKCKILVHYDHGYCTDVNLEKVKLGAFFRDRKSDLNVSLSFGTGGLISTLNYFLEKVKTPYFIFLEHDWVFLQKESIDFSKLLTAFKAHNFINAVWFSKDDNRIRGFEIAQDVNKKDTPFDNEPRVSEVDLVTTVRWSNNPAMFRFSKIKEWYENYIKNEYVGVVNQRQNNIEETIIPIYRKIISENNWEDIRDEWGTFLYGKLGDGPYVGHTDASQRYQTHNRTMAEDNADIYIKNNPLPNLD